MAKSTNPRKPSKESHRRSRKGNNEKNPPPSWEVMKNILTCKHLQVEPQPKQKHPKQKQDEDKSKKMRCTGSSLCSNTTKVMQRPTLMEPAASSPELPFYRRKPSTSSCSSPPSSSSSSVNNTSVGAMAIASSFSNNNSKNPQNAPGGPTSKGAKGMGLRRLSGCYECRMVVDPVLGFTRDPSLRATIRSCPQCGDIFMKPELLELHQAIRHAVSELGPEDTSKNIVEIIFQSSWLRNHQAAPVCKIDRILKVHNTDRTVSRFEEYRKSIKAKANGLQKKHPRCIADGNELLRFHCTTLMCSLGLNSSSNLCNSIPRCNVCSVIRDGFKPGRPILTTASSGRAHDRAGICGDHDGVERRRAMLVCRVIAGRVKKVALEEVEGGGVLEEYDSVAGVGGVYSSLDELYVHNPKAILPCFVVIYTGF
ncbi:hypothetical protein V2J09_000634 [Rumex salicifolius]